MTAQVPSVTVVMLAFGPEPLLGSAVDAALASQGVVVEVVVVDNGAEGDVVSRLSGRSGLRILRPGRNLGFAGGCNLGAAQATGTYVALVNSDALIAADALAELVAVAARPEVGIATASLRLMEDPESMNSAGNPIHITGLAWAGAYGEPVAAHQVSRSVSTASGACLLLERTLWESLDGFAPEYFAYLEDVELSLRVRGRGLDIVYVPGAVVTHDYAFARNPQKMYLIERNRAILVLTMFSTRMLLVLAPVLLLAEVIVVVRSLLQGWLGQKVAGWAWLVRNARWVRDRRRRVQNERPIDDHGFAALLTPLLPAHHPGLPNYARLANPFLGAYWALVRRLL